MTSPGPLPIETGSGAVFARPLQPLDLLDRYELLARYASGGMATVWLARLCGKHGFEKLVAVKTILPELAADQAFRSMLLDEARIAARIRHPNVAEIDDLGEAHGVPYLVFEWIDGDSLATLHQAAAERGEALPQDLLLRVVADACLGLHAAHTLRDELDVPLSVVHRDVSPQNLMIAHTGVTKVIDFGVARARDRLSPKTKTGLMKGKIEYAAPEQATLGAIDARTDVFSLGVILFQLLTGKLPYLGPNGRPLLAAVVRATAAPPLPAFIPHSVAEIVRRAIAPRAEERFQSALELSAALSSVMARPFSTSDVAAYLQAHLGHRIEQRRVLIAEARHLADARASRGRGDMGVIRGAPAPRREPTASPALEPRDPTLGASELPVPVRATSGQRLLVAVGAAVVGAVWIGVGLLAAAPRRDAEPVAAEARAPASIAAIPTPAASVLPPSAPSAPRVAPSTVMDPPSGAASATAPSPVAPVDTGRQGPPAVRHAPPSVAKTAPSPARVKPPATAKKRPVDDGF